MTTEDAARVARRPRRPAGGTGAEMALCLDFDGTLSPIVTTRRPPGHWPAWSSCAWTAGRPVRGRGAGLGPPGRRPGRARLASGVRYLGLYELREIRDGRVWVDPRLEAGRPAVVAAQKDLRDSPPSATAVPGRRTSSTRWPSTAGGSPIPSKLVWSCAGTCLATRATPSGGWSC